MKNFQYFEFYYFRGEKLYVTKDKRSGKSSKRVLWIALGVIAIVAIIIAILAASEYISIVKKINHIWTFKSIQSSIFPTKNIYNAQHHKFQKYLNKILSTY